MQSKSTVKWTITSSLFPFCHVFVQKQLVHYLFIKWLLTWKLIVTRQNSVKVIKVNPQLTQNRRYVTAYCTSDFVQFCETRRSSDPDSNVVECDVVRLETGYKAVLKCRSA